MVKIIRGSINTKTLLFSIVIILSILSFSHTAKAKPINRETSQQDMTISSVANYQGQQKDNIETKASYSARVLQSWDANISSGTSEYGSPYNKVYIDIYWSDYYYYTTNSYSTDSLGWVWHFVRTYYCF